MRMGVVLMAAAAGRALASGTIVGLGVPAPWVSTAAYGLSADGLVVVGSGGNSSANRAWRWTAAGGMVPLAVLPGDGSAWANGVSADGAIAVGWAVDHAGLICAVRWTGIGPGAIQDLGQIGMMGYYESYAANGNGTIVVGNAEVGGGTGFRWVALQGMQNLTALSGGLHVLGVSADGLTYTGWHPGLEGYCAATWTSAGGIRELGLAKAWYLMGEARLSSADGSVIVGVLKDFSTGMTVVSSPFRWTEGTGARFIGMSHVRGMSPAGDVVVGSHQHSWRPPEVPDTAGLWTAALGAVELQDYLVSRGVNMSGWRLEFASGVSVGGRVIVGGGGHTVGGTERFEAFLVTLDGGVPTCHANCDLSTATPVLNVADFTCFMNRFAQHDPYANCDGSTADPWLNVQDFVCFMNAFAGGCS